MVRTIRDFPAKQQNGRTAATAIGSDGNPPLSIPADSVFDELIAGLTSPPDIAPPDIAPTVAPGIAPPPDVAVNDPARLKLPSVDNFCFEEAAARRMASKLAPDRKSQGKKRRPVYRSPRHDRWRFPDERADEPDARNAEYDADSWSLSHMAAAPRGSGHGVFWSFCASILIVTSTSAAFGFVGPLNDLLPERVGDVLSEISDELGAKGARLFSRADRHATIATNIPIHIEVAGDNAASGPRSPIGPVSPGVNIGQPMMATAAVAPTPPAAVAPAPTPPADLSVWPFTTSGDSSHGDLAELFGVAAEQRYELGVMVLELDAIENAAAEFAAPEPAAPAADLANVNDDYRPMPVVQHTVKADPPAIANEPVSSVAQTPMPALQQTVEADPPVIADEPVTNVAQPPASGLSTAQIDGQLARAEKLLQNGDIASARLLFERIAAAGEARGAMGVGKTYDPDVYARLPVAGLTPDREQAEIWYKKAGMNSSPFPATAPAITVVADTRILQEPATPALKSPESRSPARNAACARKYNSYEPSTGLYTSYSGAKRRCRLP